MNNLSVFSRVLAILVTASLISCISCRSTGKDPAAHSIDSLILQIDDIQTAIGSPEVQRLNEFYQEIRDDLARLFSSGIDSIINMEIILSYRQLDTDLNSCLQSCASFHEEAFMIETSLSEISGLLEKKQSNTGEIETRLQNETELLKDLRRRVDSTRSSADLNVRTYYLLKPRIDSLINLSGSTAGNHE